MRPNLVEGQIIRPREGGMMKSRAVAWQGTQRRWIILCDRVDSLSGQWLGQIAPEKA